MYLGVLFFNCFIRNCGAATLPMMEKTTHPNFLQSLSCKFSINWGHMTNKSLLSNRVHNRDCWDTLGYKSSLFLAQVYRIKSAFFFCPPYFFVFSVLVRIFLFFFALASPKLRKSFSYLLRGRNIELLLVSYAGSDLW